MDDLEHTPHLRCCDVGLSSEFDVSLYDLFFFLQQIVCEATYTAIWRKRQRRKQLMHQWAAFDQQQNKVKHSTHYRPTSRHDATAFLFMGNGVC